MVSSATVVFSIFGVLALCGCDRSSDALPKSDAAGSADPPASVGATSASDALQQSSRSQQTTSAGDCATILQNIQAGLNVTVNITCDVPTEKKIILAVINGKWKSQCPIAVPETGWTVIKDDLSDNYRIIPGAGTYFAKYDFKFGVVPNTGSQASFVYANQLDWSTVHEQLPMWTQDEYDHLAKVSELVPIGVGTISEEASALIYSGPDADLSKTLADLKARRVGGFSVRHKIQYEDGVDVQSVEVSVYDIDSTYHSSVTVIPLVEPYPQWGQNEASATDFELSCDASKQISKETFQTLCSAFIEQHTINPDILDGSACDKGSDAQQEQTGASTQE